MKLYTKYQQPGPGPSSLRQEFFLVFHFMCLCNRSALDGVGGREGIFYSRAIIWTIFVKAVINLPFSLAESN